MVVALSRCQEGNGDKDLGCLTLALDFLRFLLVLFLSVPLPVGFHLAQYIFLKDKLRTSQCTIQGEVVETAINWLHFKIKTVLVS